MKISACVLTYNEEINLPRVLDTLSFCDEIVVLDHFSTDKTPEIARAHPKVKFFQEPFAGFCTQKNRLLTLASYDWVLNVDADEVLDDQAVSALQATLKSESPCAAYRIARKCIYLGRWIRHGGWYPDYQIRFFNKRKAQWAGQETHEVVKVAAQENVGMLQGNIVHLSFRDIAHQLEKNNFYSTRLAAQIATENRVSLLAMVIRPILTFVRMYVFKAGFLDGIPGLVVAVNSAASTFSKYAKAWELRHVGKTYPG